MAAIMKHHAWPRLLIPLTVALFARGASLGAQTPAVAARPVSTEQLLKRYVQRGVFDLEDPKVQPLESLVGRSGKSPRLEKVAERVAKALEIPLEAAQPLLRAFLLDEDRSAALKPEATPDESSALFDQALGLAPGSRWVRAYALRHYDGSGDHDPDVPTKITKLIRNAPSPAQTALDFADWVGHANAEAALSIAAESSPSNPLLFLKGSNCASEANPGRAAALAEWGYLLLAHDPSAPKDLVRLAATTFIKELVTGGDPGRAVSFWNSLPEEMKSHLLGKQPLVGHVTFGDCQASLSVPDDIRINLALAMLSVEGSVRARPFLDGLKDLDAPDAANPEGSSTPYASEKEQRQLERKALERFMDPDPSDPFDLVVAITGPSMGSGRLPDSLTWQKEVLEWASREGYGPVIQHSSVASFEWLDREPTSPPGLQVVWPESLSPSIRDHQSRTASAKAVLLDQMKEKAPVSAMDSSAAMTRRLLAEPRLVPFKEQHLPQGMRAGADGRDELTARTKEILLKTHFPDYFAPVRAEMDGNEVVVIGTSQDLDPVGEVSPGGYWVARSRDGGRTWGSPLYTGLQVYRPYVVKLDSSLSMIDGDHLRVEVSVKELDDKSVTFPPLGLQVKRSVEGLYLDFPWTELEKDSDGDGLTDLMEEKLLTDPHDSDSDGDGLPDGFDPMPQVRNSIPLDGRTASAVAAILNATCIKESRAILPGLATPGESPEAALQRAIGGSGKVALSSRGATFICAPRDLFAGVLPKDRVVVLTEEEAELVRKKFGVFYPIEFTNLFFNRAHDRAFCAWSASWTGGSLLLTWANGKWSVKVVGSWIT